MKPNVLLILLVGVCLGNAFGQSPYASLQVPKQIQYQGRVATGTGGAWTGTEGYFAFALVQGATVLWNNWEGTASPSDPGAVSLGAGQVMTLPVNQGVFSLRLGEGSDINEQIPPTVFFDTVSNSVRSGVKLAVWFSADGGTFTRLSPDVEFASVPFAMVSGIAESVKERAVTTAMLADDAVSSVKLIDGSISASDLGDPVKQGLNPVGSVEIYAGAVTDTDTLAEPVPGYLLCNGATIDSSASGGKYAALVASLQTAWGNGGDSNPATVNVPDLRGVFLRGSTGAAVDSYVDPDRTGRAARKPGGNVGNLVGSYQRDEIAQHFHNMETFSELALGNIGNGNSARITVEDGPPFEGIVFANRTKLAGGNETRPKNVNVNYIIKY